MQTTDTFVMLPRLRSRGSIEGAACGLRRAPGSCFRGFAAAAPLKEVGSGTGNVKPRSFRGFAAAAPLKAGLGFLGRLVVGASAASQPRLH